MEVTETTFLGVIFDYKLNWSPHIRYVSKTIAKGVGIILKARNLFNQETLLAGCIVHGVPPRTNVEKLCFVFNILSVKRLHCYNIRIFMYKFSKNMLPELFENFF